MRHIYYPNATKMPRRALCSKAEGLKEGGDNGVFRQSKQAFSAVVVEHHQWTDAPL